MSDELNPYPGNMKQHKVDPLMPDDPYLTELRKALEPMEPEMDTAKQFLLLAGERDALLAARAKDAEEIAKWKGIVKGVHGAMNDIGTVPVPPLDADLYETIMAMRAKDAERIEQIESLCRAIGNGLAEMMRPSNIECDGAYCTGCWKDINRQLVKMLLVAGFKPSKQ